MTRNIDTVSLLNSLMDGDFVLINSNKYTVISTMNGWTVHNCFGLMESSLNIGHDQAKLISFLVNIQEN